MDSCKKPFNFSKVKCSKFYADSTHIGVKMEKIVQYPMCSTYMYGRKYNCKIRYYHLKYLKVYFSLLLCKLHFFSHFGQYVESSLVYIYFFATI